MVGREPREEEAGCTVNATIIEPLLPSAPWVSMSTDPAAWAAADPKLLDTMLTSMVLVRAFEEKVLELAGQGLVHGPAHSAIGQEGGAVGSVLAMRGSDQINGSHRAHHQFLAKALHYVAPDGLASSDQFGDDVRTIADRTMAEILGLSRGYCKGRGGSMHLRWAESGNLGTNAIVGGGVQLRRRGLFYVFVLYKRGMKVAVLRGLAVRR